MCESKFVSATQALNITQAVLCWHYDSPRTMDEQKGIKNRLLVLRENCPTRHKINFNQHTFFLPWFARADDVHAPNLPHVQYHLTSSTHPTIPVCIETLLPHWQVFGKSGKSKARSTMTFLCEIACTSASERSSPKPKLCEWSGWFPADEVKRAKEIPISHYHNQNTYQKPRKNKHEHMTTAMSKVYVWQNHTWW